MEQIMKWIELKHEIDGVNHEIDGAIHEIDGANHVK